MPKINLLLQQKLHHRLTPQQIQLLQLVQLNVLDLEQKIKLELEENPFLEEVVETLSLDDEDAPSEVNEDYSAEYNSTGNELELQENLQESTITRIRTQLNFLNLTYQQLVIADEILGSIDDNGYLTTSVDKITENLNQLKATTSISIADVEWLLKIIQHLEPIAIGSRSLQECLLIQLHINSKNSHLALLAENVIKDYFDLFSKKHFEEIAKKLKISISIMKKINELINSLNPKPGESLNNPSMIIIPDVIIRQVNEKIIVKVNEAKIPKMKLKKEYYDAFNSSDININEFLDKKYSTAKFILHALDLRRSTLGKVTNEIVKHQQEYFLSQGTLKPLTNKIIAENLKVDESTISRVVHGKYAQTDYGVFPLRYYFGEGIHTKSGEDISTKEILFKLTDFVKKENPQKPHSDLQLQKLVEDSGFKISRRTITKYRENLHIPIARLRRKL